jgi:hypothetical protein
MEPIAKAAEAPPNYRVGGRSPQTELEAAAAAQGATQLRVLDSPPAQR